MHEETSLPINYDEHERGGLLFSWRAIFPCLCEGEVLTFIGRYLLMAR